MKLVLTITSFHKFTPEIESEFVFESSDEHAKVTSDAQNNVTGRYQTLRELFLGLTAN